MNSVNTIIMIGGFVILFSVIISILNNSGLLNIISSLLYPLFHTFGIDVKFISPIVSGLVEVTNGLNSLTHISTKSLSAKIIFSSFILGFGGISVMLQVLSIISKQDISIKPYIIGKFLQGIISAFLTYVFIHIFPIFNLDLAPIVSQNVNMLPVVQSYLSSYNILIFIVILITTCFIIANRKKYNIYNH